MSDEPKKRPPFQIHLSTAVVLMLIISVQLGASIFGWAYARPMALPKGMTIQETRLGSPFVFFDSIRATNPSGSSYRSINTHLDFLALDAAIPLVVALLLERSIRRRERESAESCAGKD